MRKIHASLITIVTPIVKTSSGLQKVNNRASQWLVQLSYRLIQSGRKSFLSYPQYPRILRGMLNTGYNFVATDFAELGMDA